MSRAASKGRAPGGGGWMEALSSVHGRSCTYGHSRSMRATSKTLSSGQTCGMGVEAPSSTHCGSSAAGPSERSHRHIILGSTSCLRSTRAMAMALRSAAMCRSMRARCAPSRGDHLSAVETGQPLPSAVLPGISRPEGSEGSRSAGAGPGAGGSKERYFWSKGSGMTGISPASRSRQCLAGFLGQPST